MNSRFCWPRKGFDAVNDFAVNCSHEGYNHEGVQAAREQLKKGATPR